MKKKNSGKRKCIEDEKKRKKLTMVHVGGRFAVEYYADAT